MTRLNALLMLLSAPKGAEELAEHTGRKLESVRADLRVLERNDRAIRIDEDIWVARGAAPCGQWSAEALECVADRVFRVIQAEDERGVYTSRWLAEAIGRPADMVRAAVLMMCEDERLVRTHDGWKLPDGHWRNDA